VCVRAHWSDGADIPWVAWTRASGLFAPSLSEHHPLRTAPSPSVSQRRGPTCVHTVVPCRYHTSALPSLAFYNWMRRTVTGPKRRRLSPICRSSRCSDLGFLCLTEALPGGDTPWARLFAFWITHTAICCNLHNSSNRYSRITTQSGYKHTPSVKMLCPQSKLSSYIFVKT